MSEVQCADVDKEFKDEWLEKLNSIPGIEIRSTDIGHSSERVAFVIFRFKNKKLDNKANAIVSELKKFPKIYAKTDIGMEGRPRICVAGKVIVEKPGWEHWWRTLAEKIDSAISVILGMVSSLSKNVSSLYYYPIRDFIPFPEPRSIAVIPKSQNLTVLPGTQAGTKKIKYLEKKIDFARITAESIKALNNMDLVMLHAEVHDAWEERGMRKNDELMINLHILIIEEMARRNMEHRIQDGLDEISIESRGLKIKDKVYLKDWLKLYNQGFYLKDPFMAAIGSIAISGRGNDADIWINLPLGKNCPVCEKLFGDLEFRLRSFLNENLNNRIKFTPHLVPDPEGKFTNYLEIAKLKVEIIPPEERRFVTMEQKQGMEQKQKIEVGKPFVPLKCRAGAYGTYEFFDKEELWNKWMIKYMKDC